MAEDLATAAKEAIYALGEEETGRKVGELTVVTEVAEVTPGVLRVTFTPLSAYSPTAVDLGRRIRDAAGKVVGVNKVVVECKGHMQDDLVNTLVNGL
jgi:metal-sulfur cluster biosynthetic enzyme